MWEAQLWRKLSFAQKSSVGNLGVSTGISQSPLLDDGSMQLDILLPRCCLLSVLLLKSLTNPLGFAARSQLGAPTDCLKGISLGVASTQYDDII